MKNAGFHSDPASFQASLVPQMVNDLPSMQETRVQSPGEWNGYPLQHSCPENPTERGTWWGGKESDPLTLAALAPALTIRSKTKVAGMLTFTPRDSGCSSLPKIFVYRSESLYHGEVEKSSYGLAAP